MRVFLTGATGLVGRALARSLVDAGHEVVALSRDPARGRLPTGAVPIAGDPGRGGAWQEALGRCDACVHLAGEPVADGRWTEERKRRIRDSRVESTRRVAEVIAAGGPRVLVSGSAVGYYGSRGDEILDEGSPPGDDFLARVAVEWERAAQGATRRARVAIVRTGLVLARDGGALPRMAAPFRWLAGGALGDGTAWQPWIHLDDEVGLLRLALEDERVTGPLVAAAPEPVRNRDLARAIGRVLRRPAWVPAPVLALRAVLGELADAVLSSQRAVPRRALELGHRFRWPTLEPALRDLLAERTP